MFQHGLLVLEPLPPFAPTIMTVALVSVRKNHRTIHALISLAKAVVKQSTMVQSREWMTTACGAEVPARGKILVHVGSICVEARSHKLTVKRLKPMDRRMMRMTLVSGIHLQTVVLANVPVVSRICVQATLIGAKTTHSVLLIPSSHSRGLFQAAATLQTTAANQVHRAHHREDQPSALDMVAQVTPFSSLIPTTLTEAPTHREIVASIPNVVAILTIVPLTTIALSLANNYDQMLKIFNELVEVGNKRTAAKQREPPPQVSAAATLTATKMFNVLVACH